MSLFGCITTVCISRIEPLKFFCPCSCKYNVRFVYPSFVFLLVNKTLYWSFVGLVVERRPTVNLKYTELLPGQYLNRPTRVFIGVGNKYIREIYIYTFNICLENPLIWRILYQDCWKFTLQSLKMAILLAFFRKIFRGSIPPDPQYWYIFDTTCFVTWWRHIEGPRPIDLLWAPHLINPALCQIIVKRHFSLTLLWYAMKSYKTCPTYH